MNICMYICIVYREIFCFELTEIVWGFFFWFSRSSWNVCMCTKSQSLFDNNISRKYENSKQRDNNAVRRWKLYIYFFVLLLLLLLVVVFCLSIRIHNNKVEFRFQNFPPFGTLDSEINCSLFNNFQIGNRCFCSVHRITWKWWMGCMQRVSYVSCAIYFHLWARREGGNIIFIADVYFFSFYLLGILLSLTVLFHSIVCMAIDGHSLKLSHSASWPPTSTLRLFLFSSFFFPPFRISPFFANFYPMQCGIQIIAATSMACIDQIN